ncbi:MAG: hypothetical protein M0026_07980 [Nocardiopsaceae bacterium]|nr:hypothetical protein [Nocardiopsaceae bacterium]
MNTTTALEIRIVPDAEMAEFQRVQQVFTDLRSALDEIDRVYLPVRSPRPVWRLLSLNSGDGEFRVRLTATGTKRRPAADLLRPVKALVDGVAHLHDVPEVPRFYMANTVARIAHAGRVGRGVREVSVAEVNGRVGPHVAISRPVVTNARQAVQERQQSYGSVSGILETLSSGRERRQGKGGSIHVGIFDPDARSAVRGEVPPDLEVQLRDLWAHRVLAGGVVTRNQRGQVISIRVDRLEQMPEDDSARASVAELLGADPDWLGGQRVDDYIREIRRG